MELIADTLMVAGSFGAAVYCYVLAARLKRFTTLETGMGGAIAVLSAQVDDMTTALEQARGAATGSAASLESLTARGETVAKRLELLVAALHDLPDPAATRAAAPRPVAPEARPAESPSEAEDGVAADTGTRLRFVRRRMQRDTLEAAE